MIGNVKTNELLGIKKISFRGKVTKNINFICPKDIDNDSIQLFWFSDSYIGIDQQYPIRLDAMNKSICKKYNLKYESFVSSDEKDSDFTLFENIGDEEVDGKEDSTSDDEESLDDVCFE